MLRTGQDYSEETGDGREGVTAYCENARSPKNINL
jgi:hypothetical protein